MISNQTREDETKREETITIYISWLEVRWEKMSQN